MPLESFTRQMDELSNLSPASRERSLDELPRKELQQLAKEAGVKVLADQTFCPVHISALYISQPCTAEIIAACRATSRARRLSKVF